MCHKLSCEVLSVRTIIIYLMFIQMVKRKFSCFPEKKMKKKKKEDPCVHAIEIYGINVTSKISFIYIRADT